MTEELTAQVAALTASVEALTQENFELRAVNLDYADYAEMMAKVEALEASRRGFELARNYWRERVSTDKAEREALITAVGQIGREMQASLDADEHDVLVAQVEHLATLGEKP